jgi:hypothetical protein
MKKFLALYMAPTTSMDEMMKTWSQEQMKAGMERWAVWMDAHKSLFIDQGAPAGKNMRVTSQGATAMRNEVTGYSIMQANSADEVSSILKDSPHFEIPGAYVELTELLDMSAK